MRAIVAHTAGGPEVLNLESVALPSPGPTEVLVRVNAAGVNPADWKNRRSGNLVAPPQTPGWDQRPSRRGFRIVVGPWGWMLLIYTYDEPADRVIVVSAQDARRSSSATSLEA